ncbi:MAG: hypothetical protein ACLTFZ_09245 [Lachnospiraceae bacterium]
MTVNQMLLLSRVFLGAMILFTIAAVIIYFSFDIRRAWRILTNKSIPVNHTKYKKADYKIQKNTSDLIQKQMQTNRLQMQNEEVTQILQKGENADSSDKGQDVTTVLGDTQDTVLLVSQQEQDNKNNVLLDITFIHTELVL